MPLLACPGCGRDVSDAADACLHCGRAMRVAPQAIYPPPSPGIEALAAPGMECPSCRVTLPSVYTACPVCHARTVPAGSLKPHAFAGVPVRFAGFGRRFAARLVDMAVLLPGIVWLYHAYTISPHAVVRANLVYMLAASAYAVIPVALWGRTLGKAALGIQILRADGRRAGWLAALLREIVQVALGIVGLAGALATASHLRGLPFAHGTWSEGMHSFSAARPKWSRFGARVELGWVLVDALVFFTNRRRRALHDLIAGTIVIRTR